MYANTIHTFCAEKNVFVKYEAQGILTPTPPCVDVMYL